MSESVNSARARGLHLGAEAGAFGAAAERFMARLNTKDAQDFKRTTRDHVYHNLRIMQAQQQETRTLMNLKRLQLFLNGMTALQNALLQLGLPETPTVMACIWGPMKFFLKTTRLDERAFDHVLDVYQRLGPQIPQLAMYRRLFEDSPNNMTCLVHIYEDVLVFHELAYKLFSLRSSLWGKLHRATWKDLEPTFDHLAASLKLHSDFILEQAGPHRMESGLGAEPNGNVDRQFGMYIAEYDNARRRFAESEEDRKLKQRDKILKWIAAGNRTEILDRGFAETRELCPENGSWVWRQHDEVINWMQEQPAEWPTVWAHGRKGMGKTILSSTVIEHLRRMSTSKKIPRDSQVYFFYCQEGDEELATYLGILKTILHQLVSKTTPDRNGDNNAAILPLCEDKMTNSGGAMLSNPEVAQALIGVFFETNARQYVVIDGLDECKPTEIQQAVKFFTSEVLRCDELSQGQLRVLFMSESTSEMQKVMTKCGIAPKAGEVALHPGGNAQDIRRYVRTMLGGRTGMNFNLLPEEKLDIEHRISAQSEGLFLYAHLAMETLLKQLTKADLLGKVGKLPEDISQMYNTLLDTVRARLLDLSVTHWEKAKLLLGWLVCAHRPLKWHELQAILAFNPITEEVDFERNMIRRENITALLGSLVQVLDGGNIGLIHSTSKEHLVETEHINAKSVQCDLAILCLRYLSLPCFAAAEGLHEDQRRDLVLKGYFSFQDYAMSQWFRHIITVVEHCRLSFSQAVPSADFTGPFASALEKFISAHDADIKPLSEVASDLPLEHIDKFKDLPFHSNLLRLWNHIYQHQNASTIEERNKVGIPGLDAALASHRALIETGEFFFPDRQKVGADTMADYYGPNLFKCPRTLCRFFHHGFDGRKDRDGHQNRHDRPYPCPLEGRCGFAPVGFSSNKDRQRHVRNYHPELSDAPSAFLQMSRRVETARFRCAICQKSFTRNVNLKGHERSHFGERPYACSHCGKAFARVNDCRRHERIHTRKG